MLAGAAPGVTVTAGNSTQAGGGSVVELSSVLEPPTTENVDFADVPSALAQTQVRSWLLTTAAGEELWFFPGQLI